MFVNLIPQDIGLSSQYKGQKNTASGISRHLKQYFKNYLRSGCTLTLGAS